MVTHWTEYDVDVLFLTSSRTSLGINPDPWSVLLVPGIPCNVMYFLREFITDLADVLDFIYANGNFENGLTHTSMYFLFPKLMEAGQQSLIPFLDLVQRPREIFQGYHVLSVASTFYLLLNTRYKALHLLAFLCRFSASRCRGCQDFH